MRFYSFVLKNVARRRVRSTLTVISMALAVGAVVALVGVSSGFERSFMDVYQRQKVDIIVQQRGIKQRLTSVLPVKLGDRIAKIPGVKPLETPTRATTAPTANAMLMTVSVERTRRRATFFKTKP